MFRSITYVCIHAHTHIHTLYTYNYVWFTSVSSSKTLFIHVQYLETCQCCVSLLLSLWVVVQASLLHLHWSGSYVSVNRHHCQQAQEVFAQTRRPIFLQSHIFEESSGILGLHFWTADSTESLQPLWGCARVHRLDLEHFVQIWSTWTDYVNLQNIPEMVMHAQAVNTRPLSLLPHGLVTRLLYIPH